MIKQVCLSSFLYIFVCLQKSKSCYMDSFVVSARKYRPASFDMVIGQDTITQTLKNAIVNNHLASAYLFCGPRGVGKTTCARIFAKTINCFNLKADAEACDECESCKSFNSSRSYNIHELDAASNNSVDDIRSLSDKVRIPPQVGKYSIYIIDEVHMLSTAAFNAFLKTLEEPPAHAIFILATTEKNKILATILSRCQVFDFNRIKIEDISNKLKYISKQEDVDIEEEAIHVIARKADGAMRDALSIFDQLVSLCGKHITYKNVIANLNVLDYEYYFKVSDAILSGDVSTVLLTFNEIVSKGFDEYNFLLGLNSHFRDLLVSKDAATVKLLETTQTVRQQYIEQAAKCPIAFLYSALDIGSSYDVSYKNSKNQCLHVELALIKLCSLHAGLDMNNEKKKSELANNKHDKEQTVLKDGEVAGRTPATSAHVTLDDTTISSTNKQINDNQPIPSRLSGNINVTSHEIGVTAENHRTISIKDVITSPSKIPLYNNNKTREEEPSSTVDVMSSKTDKTTVMNAWAKFNELHNNDSTRVASMFSTITPIYNEKNNSLEISFKNSAQKELFVFDYKQSLLTYLKDNHGITGLDIETSVEEIEKEQLIYTNMQKLQYFQSNNTLFNDFLKEFQLTI